MNFFIRKIRVELAGFSRISAATAQIRQSGGNTGEFRGTQRHQPNQPFGNYVNSAGSRLFLACHFSG